MFHTSMGLAKVCLVGQYMRMQAQQAIQELGYKPNEAKVYLAALGLGECHVTDIAQKVHLPRSSVQVIVDKLHEDGLMSFYVQRRYKYWVAEHPERLIGRLEQRSAHIREVLPALVALRKEGHEKRRHSKGRSSALGIFRALADSSLQPVLVTNDGAEIMYVNAAWEQTLGYTLQEVAGKNPRILQSGKTPRTVYEKMWKLLKAGKMFQTDEVVNKKKDGTLCHLTATIFRVEHEGVALYVQIFDC